jgi:hypothetical protein
MVGQPFKNVKTRLQVLGKGTIGASGTPPEMVYNSGKPWGGEAVLVTWLGAMYPSSLCLLQQLRQRCLATAAAPIPLPLLRAANSASVHTAAPG